MKMPPHKMSADDLMEWVYEHDYDLWRNFYWLTGHDFMCGEDTGVYAMIEDEILNGTSYAKVTIGDL